MPSRIVLIMKSNRLKELKEAEMKGRLQARLGLPPVYDSSDNMINRKYRTGYRHGQRLRKSLRCHRSPTLTQ